MRLRRLTVPALLVATALPAPAAVSAPDEGAYIVHFADRITDASRDAVEATGLEIIAYEPRDAYMVWGDASQAEAAERLDEVLWAGPVPAERKLSSAIPDRAIVLADVTVYAPALARARAGLSSLGEVLGMGLAGSDGTVATLAVNLPRVALPAAAELPGVLYISPGATRLIPMDEATDQIVGGNIDLATNRPIPGYAQWLEDMGLDGDGVKVAVVDTGISSHHPDLQGRVEKVTCFPGSPGSDQDSFGHGTHIAGIIGGNPPEPHADPEGFVYGLGLAPAVRLVDVNIGPRLGLCLGCRCTSLADRSREAWRAGTRLWNGSFGIGSDARAGYTSHTRMMDVLSRDADLEAPGSEQYLFVQAAGNVSQGGPIVPSAAKNVISVGSTQSGRLPPRDIDHVSDFSSRGPTQDGRVFPTVVAPGANVMSARAPESVEVTLLCESPSDEGAILYTMCSGTSFSAPQVTGAAALIHQWWERETRTLPSPAMVKALLVNGATDIAERDIPNDDEGWGRINLGSVFGQMPGLWEDQATVFDGPGEQVSWVVEADGSRPLRTTLTWSDAPAAVGADPALVNDLDLIVELLDEGGQVVKTWLGNVLAEGQSKSGGTADRLNNLENVFLEAPEAGTYRFTVRAHDIPGDGIPYNEDATDQDFALLVRGGVRVEG